MQRVYKASLFLAFSFILFCWPKSIVAATQTDGTLNLVPAYLEVTLDKPDETNQVQIVLTNNSQHQVTLQMFPIDFKQKEPDGITTFIGQTDQTYSYSLASFLSLESDTLVLDPGERKPFSIQVTNRKDVSPGGHYAAIVAKLVTENPTGSATNLSPAISSLIYLRKTGGEKFNLLLKDISWPDTSVVFSYSTYMKLVFQNEGNVHVVPYGLVQVTDALKRVIYKGIINTSSARILPETRRDIDVTLQKMAGSTPVSFNTVIVTGHDSLGKVRYTFSRHFVYINPLCFVVLAAALFLAFKIVKKKKK